MASLFPSNFSVLPCSAVGRLLGTSTGVEPGTGATAGHWARARTPAGYRVSSSASGSVLGTVIEAQHMDLQHLDVSTMLLQDVPPRPTFDWEILLASHASQLWSLDEGSTLTLSLKNILHVPLLYIDPSISSTSIP
jgi:hypothetical protein